MSKLSAYILLSVTQLVLGTSSAWAQLQGTLFTSPEQRVYLDYLREEQMARSRDRGFDIDETLIPQIPTELAAPPPEPVIYRLGGIMSRRDGSYSIWLNGRSLSEDELPSEATLANDNGTLALRFRTQQSSVLIKPGQTLNFDTGQVQESYQDSPTAPAAIKAAPDDEAVEAEAATSPEGNATSVAIGKTATTKDAASTSAQDVATNDDTLLDAEQLQAMAAELNVSAADLQTLLQAMQAAAAEAGDAAE